MTEIEYKIVENLMIEKLEMLKDEIAEKDAKIEALKENNKAIMHTIAGVHTEAIKEFADMLKTKYSQADILCPRRIVSLTEKDLDNLVIEMVGDEK